eukprot:g8588.t1
MSGIILRKLAVFLVVVFACTAAGKATALQQKEQRRAVFEVVSDTYLRELLDDISKWIMTVDLPSNNITGNKDTLHTSIFINSNLARILLANYKISGNREYLSVGLAWCDTFVTLQHEIETSSKQMGGYWDTGYSELYIADTGTAVTALAVCYDLANTESRRVEYKAAMLKFDLFVRFGSTSTPQCSFTPNCAYDGGKGETADSFVLDSGALGDGYYKSAINLTPYTISTATTGGAFYAELFALSSKGDQSGSSSAIGGDSAYEAVATNAVHWILKSRTSDGAIPYTITPPSAHEQVYQAVTYSTEAFVDSHLRFGAKTFPELKTLRSTVSFVLDHQAPDGILIINGTQGEQQRSPRAISLLQWYLENVSDDKAFEERIKVAIGKYFHYLQEHGGKTGSYGINQYALVTGFVGLVAADLLQPWCTFVST